MKIIDDFKEYEILSLNNGRKIESWNGVILDRPDPEIIWTGNNKEINVHARYERSEKGGGGWTLKKEVLPWQIHYKNLTFNLKLMGFKHTGLFPEQAYNWNLLMDTIKNENRHVKVLNLFAYTGAASMAAASAGASVLHVDSSKGMVEWAKENFKSSNLEDSDVRFFVDDVKKLVKRELRRGSKYDIIVMDPPSFGRGAKGEVWNIEKDLFPLICECTSLLSDNPLLFIINTYSTGLSKTVLENILKLTVNKKFPGKIESHELGLKLKNSDIYLPAGVTARWEKWYIGLW